LSGFALTAGLFPSGALRASTGPELAESSAIAENAIAAVKPNCAAVLSNSLPFLVFGRPFMTPTFSIRRLAAMTIIIKVLPTL
jgi:hypothetical protein